MNNDSLSPVVIGAGISGLVRALQLVKRGRRPIILDPDLGGGLIRSLEIEGFSLELGATTLVMTPEMRTLLDELHLISEPRYPAIARFQQFIWHRGTAFAVPRGPLALLSSNLFSPSEKFHILKGLFKKLPAQLKSDTCSVRDLFSGVFSAPIADRIVAPVLRGIYGGDISKLLAAFVFPKLWEHFQGGGSLIGYVRARKALGQRKIFVLNGGNDQIVQSCLAKLKQHAQILTVAAASVERGASGTFEIMTVQGEKIAASEVHVATSSGASAAILSNITPELSKKLRQIRYAPIVVVHVSVDRNCALLKDGFGVLFPPEDGNGDGALLGILFNSQLFPHVAPAGKHLLTVCFGGVGSSEIVAASDEEIDRRAKASLRDKLHISEAKILKITRWKDAIPQYEALMPAIESGMRTAEAEFPGLFFLGADRGGPGVPARVEAAQMKMM